MRYSARALRTLIVFKFTLMIIAVPAAADWLDGGNPICTAPGWQVSPLVVPDGNHGGFLAWPDQRSGDYDIYCQLVDSTGSTQWTVDGVAICNAGGDQQLVKLVADGAGGIIVTWQDGRGVDDDIYAQRVDPDGNPLWTAGGIALCTAAGNQEVPRIVTDGSGGAVVTWQDFRDPVSIM